jgi:hypothetical protein
MRAMYWTLCQGRTAFNNYHLLLVKEISSKYEYPTTWVFTLNLLCNFVDTYSLRDNVPDFLR